MLGKRFAADPALPQRALMKREKYARFLSTGEEIHKRKRRRNSSEEIIFGRKTNICIATLKDIC